MGRGSARTPVYSLNMQEVAGLYPDLAALRTSLGAERAAGREPQPDCTSKRLGSAFIADVLNLSSEAVFL